MGGLSSTLRGVAPRPDHLPTTPQHTVKGIPHLGHQYVSTYKGVLESGIDLIMRQVHGGHLHLLDYG